MQVQMDSLSELVVRVLYWWCSSACGVLITTTTQMQNSMVNEFICAPQIQIQILILWEIRHMFLPILILVARIAAT